MLQGPKIVALIGLAMFVSRSCGYYNEYGAPDKFDADASLTEQQYQYYTERNPVLAYRYLNDTATYTELLPEKLPNYYSKDLRASVMTAETEETIPEFMFEILSNFDSVELNKKSSHKTRVYDDPEYEGKENTIRWVVLPRRKEDKWVYFKNPTRTKLSKKSEKPTYSTVATDSTKTYKFITTDDTRETDTVIVNESENSDSKVAIETTESYQIITSDNITETDFLFDIITEDLTEKKKSTVIHKLPRQMGDRKRNTIVSPTRTRSVAENSSTKSKISLNINNKSLFNKTNLKEKREYKTIDGYRITRTPHRLRNLKGKKKYKAMYSTRTTSTPKIYINLKTKKGYKAKDSHRITRTKKKLRIQKKNQKYKALNESQISKTLNKLRNSRVKKENNAINEHQTFKNHKKFNNLKGKKEHETLNMYQITRTPNRVTTTSNEAYLRKKKNKNTNQLFTKTVEHQMLGPVRTRTPDKVHSNNSVGFDDYSTTLADKKSQYDKSQATAVYGEPGESLLSEKINTETPTFSFGTTNVVTRTQFELVSSKIIDILTPRVVTRTQFRPMSSKNTIAEPILTFGTTEVVTRSEFEPMLSKDTYTETPTLTLGPYHEDTRTHFEIVLSEESNTETPILNIDEAQVVTKQMQRIFSEISFAEESWNPNKNSKVIIVPLNNAENPFILPDNIENASLIPILDTLFTETESVFDDGKFLLVTGQWIGENHSNTDIDDDTSTLTQPTPTDYLDDDGGTPSFIIPSIPLDNADDDGTTPNHISESITTNDLNDDTTTYIINESTTTSSSDDDGTTTNIISESTTTSDSDDEDTTPNLITELITTVDSDGDSTTPDVISESTTTNSSDDDGTTTNFISESTMTSDAYYDEETTPNIITELTTTVDSDGDGTTPNIINQSTLTDLNVNLNDNNPIPDLITQSSKDTPTEVAGVTDLIMEAQFETATNDPNFEAIKTSSKDGFEKITTHLSSTRKNNKIIPSFNTTAKSPLRQGEAYWKVKIEGGSSQIVETFPTRKGVITSINKLDIDDVTVEGEGEPVTIKIVTRPNRNPARVDINKLLARIRNVIEGKGDPKTLYQRLNDTFQRKGIITMEYDTTTLSSNLTGTIMGKCFVCGLDQPEIPRNASCGDAFAGDFIPLVPVDPTARSQIHKYRKYCRWKDVPKYQDFRDRNIWGRWTGGCSVRWIDLSGLYTERACRNRHRATLGKSFASKRMAKLEMALQHLDEGCIMSPVASLIPLSRGISLYARFFACVCTGSWCNRAVHFVLQSPHVAVFTILGLTLEYFVGIG